MLAYECEGLLETREVLETAQPHCVLIAQDLPDGSAFELIEEWRNLSFIVLTEERDGSEAMRRGAQDHLLETALDPELVARSIRYAIERTLHGRAMDNLAHQDRLASLGQLAASVAHEINNPLSYIAANIETLQRQLDAVRERLEASDAEGVGALPLSPRETDALLEECTTGCERIVSIVKQLGSFARKSEDDEKPRKVCLSDVVSWACVLTQRRIEQRGELVQRLDDDSIFVGRRGRLAQVATNLLMNAAQALPKDGRDHKVWVSTESDDEASSLIVEDTGPGFSWSVRRRAFNPFYTTKPQGEGTGLGLSIANDIVRHHGGTLTLDNRPGGGARVVARIPHETPFVLRESLPPTRVEETESFRILFIDDEVALRRAYRRWLEPHEVVAEGGSEALERLLEQGDRAFDLVLCDFTMPDIDGLSLYQRLADEAPELLPRFVILTGGVVTAEARNALEESSIETLTKPASKETILEVARARRELSS